jgi:hypothetical protein
MYFQDKSIIKYDNVPAQGNVSCIEKQLERIIEIDRQIPDPSRIRKETKCGGEHALLVASRDDQNDPEKVLEARA